MRGLLIRWLFVTLSIVLASYLVDGIRVQNFFSAFFAAVTLGILNALLRPVLIIMTLPINILTLGLFTFVINALMLKIASGVIGGFEVLGFWAAILGSLVISITSWLLSSFVSEQGRIETIDLKRRTDDHWE
jgi:putative membrane protein